MLTAHSARLLQIVVEPGATTGSRHITIRNGNLTVSDASWRPWLVEALFQDARVGLGLSSNQQRSFRSGSDLVQNLDRVPDYLWLRLVRV